MEANNIDNSEYLSQDVAAENEDSVVQDINALKKIINKMKKSIGIKIKPYSKNIPSTKDLTKKVKTGVNKKIIRTALLVTVIVIGGLMLARLLTGFVGNGNGGSTTPTDSGVGELPTLAPFQSQEESIYAKDPEILTIDEHIKVLESEMTTTPLKESQLLPPSLEFNINFN